MALLASPEAFRVREDLRPRPVFAWSRQRLEQVVDCGSEDEKWQAARRAPIRTGAPSCVARYTGIVHNGRDPRSMAGRPANAECRRASRLDRRDPVIVDEEIDKRRAVAIESPT